MATEVITDREIYERVVQEMIPAATSFLWIATADIKDLHVKSGQTFVPFLHVLADLLHAGVAIRLIHAKEPGPVFRKDFDRFPILATHLERMLCPRMHAKTVVVDGVKAYLGSGNLTGAGMGAKHPDKRNFEAGVITDNPAMLEPIMSQFDSVWMGARCDACRRREFCGDFVSTGHPAAH